MRLTDEGATLEPDPALLEEAVHLLGLEQMASVVTAAEKTDHFPVDSREHQGPKRDRPGGSAKAAARRVPACRPVRVRRAQWDFPRKVESAYHSKSGHVGAIVLVHVAGQLCRCANGSSHRLPGSVVAASLTLASAESV